MDKTIEINEKYQDYLDTNPDICMDRREFYRLHVLNEKNKFINKKFINNIFKKYGLKHKVKNLDVYQEAFIHDSYLENSLDNIKFIRQIKDTTPIENKKDTMSLINKKSYQRLEYLGDAVIHIAIAKYLYNRYPNEDEGFLTRVRTRLENGREMSKFCKNLGLNEYVIVGRYIEQNAGRIHNYKILEDILEAFIGALSIETSIDNCIEFFINVIEKEADIADMICYETNYKGKLMKECHACKWNEVEYIDISDKNSEVKRFKIKAICANNNNGNNDIKYIGYGKGKSKKDAQQKAAKHILIKMGKIINDNIDDDDDIYGEYEDNSDDIYGEYED
jgi:dsRNA-specific ribonuclease